MITYDLTLIPLGLLSKDSNTGRQKFNLALITRLNFPSKYFLTDLSDKLDNHPLLRLDGSEVKVQTSNGEKFGTLTYKGGDDYIIQNMVSDLRKFLNLEKKNKIGLQNDEIVEKDLNRDLAFDNLTDDDFVDSKALYDRSIELRDSLAIMIANGMSVNKSSDYSENIKLNGANQLKSSVLDQINAISTELIYDCLPWLYPDEIRMSDSPIRKIETILDSIGIEGRSKNEIISYINKSSDEFTQNKWDAFQNRMLGDYDKVSSHSKHNAKEVITEEDLYDRLEKRHRNVLLNTAFKDPVFCRKLGMVTQWEVYFDEIEFEEERHHEISLDPFVQVLRGEGNQYVNNFPTVFSVSKDSMVAPAQCPHAATDVKHGGLIQLNDKNRNQRYKTAQVSVDNELIKNLYLQSSNTSQTNSRQIDHTKIHSNRNLPTYQPPECKTTKACHDQQINANKPFNLEEDKPVEINPSAKTGINQPTTSGVIFYAPKDDLLCKSSGENDKKYYLEDLWIGYRVDVKNNAQINDDFLSLHQQVAVTTCDKVSGLEYKEICIEAYIDREQIQEDRILGTEFAVWSGIGNAQNNPVSKVRPGGKIKRKLVSADQKKVAFDKSADPDPDVLNEVDLPSHIFREVEAKKGSLPRLFYKQQYEYRIRTVLTGGVSLSVKEANAVSDLNSESHTQKFCFNQVESYSPGEIIDPEHQPNHSKQANSSEEIVYLTEDKSRKKMYLVPRAINFDQCRFHNILGRKVDEIKAFKNIAITTDLKKYLVNRNRFDWQPYFLDPEVNSVKITTTSLARNPDVPPIQTSSLYEKLENQQPSEMINCEIVKHWEFDQRHLKFGRPGEWQRYRPITLEFFSSNSDLPKAYSNKRNHFKLTLAPGDVVDVSIRPNLSPNQIQQSAVFRNYENVMKKAGLPKLTSYNIASIKPIIAEKNIRVIQTTRKPLVKPFFKFDQRYQIRETLNKDDSDSVFTVPKDVLGSKGLLVGWLGVDAKTTGQVNLLVTWEDPLDHVNQPETIFRSSAFQTPSRSIVFGEKPLPKALPSHKLTSKQFETQTFDTLKSLDHQCLEDIVHFVDYPSLSDESRRSDENHVLFNEINFTDGKRRRAEVIIQATTRYREQYPEGNDPKYQRKSNTILLDVPNSIKPPSPQISHILPTFKRTKRKDQNNRIHMEEEIGLRIYLDRPFFETGSGERLAIGCTFKKDDSAEEYAKLKKYVTMWGEDPLERPKLQVTLREPKAEDFTAPEITDTDFELDERLYPDTDPDERKDVMYTTVNHILKVEDEQNQKTVVVPEKLPINLASYALRYDKSQSLWFCDVLVKGAFFGWLGLALYRHQPHSTNDDRKLSANPVFSYAAILQGDPIVYYNKDGWLHINVGPIYDETVTYHFIECNEINNGLFFKHKSESDFTYNDKTKLHSLIIENKKYKKLLIMRKRKGFNQGVIEL